MIIMLGRRQNDNNVSMHFYASLAYIRLREWKYLWRMRKLLDIVSMQDIDILAYMRDQRLCMIFGAKKPSN